MAKKKIVVFAETTALIDSELNFFKHTYKKLIEENPNLADKKLTVFLNVQAGLSSGSNVFKVTKSGELKEGNWDKFIKYLSDLGITNGEDVENSDKLERYRVYL